MPDELDRLQDMTERHMVDALKHHAERPQRPGLTHCEMMDCGEPISAQRQQMGARLCVTCQTAEEAQAAHFRTWSRR
ncbi:TraR/DksA C4-type zinc finger protein [Lysobacter olei]